MTQDQVLKNQDFKEGILKFHFLSKNVSLNLNYTFLISICFISNTRLKLAKKIKQKLSKTLRLNFYLGENSLSSFMLLSKNNSHFKKCAKTTASVLMRLYD